MSGSDLGRNAASHNTLAAMSARLAEAESESLDTIPQTWPDKSLIPRFALPPPALALASAVEAPSPGIDELPVAHRACFRASGTQTS